MNLKGYIMRKFKLKQKWRGVLDSGSWRTGLLLGSIHTDQPVPFSKPNLQETPGQEKDQQQRIVREKE